MNKTRANEVLAACVNDYIIQGGLASDLAGWDRVAVLELADALEKLGFKESAQTARDEGSNLH